MAYPGAHRPHGGRTTVITPDYPGYQGPPPQQQQQYGGYGGPQQGYGGYPQQPQYNNGPYGGGEVYQNTPGGFPHPNIPQQYAPPSGFPGGPPPQQSGYGAPPGPPPHYGQAPQTQQPAMYSGQNFPIHTLPQNPQNGFSYSNCSGKRKALCIGINYTGTSSALRGCHNDAQNMAKFLCERHGYKQDDIVMLLDGMGGMSEPTRANITRACQWLTAGAAPNDSLFFHYSGHGGTTRDTDGDEDDGYDETIYPIDFKQSGQIVDDELHEMLVRPLPRGCRLTAIFDSCHSGSALDLPYMYDTSGKLKEPNLLKDTGMGALSAATSYLRGDLGGVFKAVGGVGKKLMNGGKVNEQVKQYKMSEADVISWSGCKDSQTSADTQEAGKATGAMSWAFIRVMSQYPQVSYNQALNLVRDEMRGRYSQRPQLSCSHELDCNLLFII